MNECNIITVAKDLKGKLTTRSEAVSSPYPSVNSWSFRKQIINQNKKNLFKDENPLNRSNKTVSSLELPNKTE